MIRSIPCNICRNTTDYNYLFSLATLTTVPTVTSTAAFPIFLISSHDHNRNDHNHSDRQKDKYIYNIHTLPPTLQSNCHADEPYNKSNDPRYYTLPEDDPYCPSCSQFSFNRSNGCNTWCIQQREY